MLTADLRAAARRLRRSPTLTAAIIGTLALTIGATTMVHTVVQRVLLDPLPLPDSDRLVWIDHAGPGIGAARGLGLTQGIYGHYRELPRSTTRPDQGSSAGYGRASPRRAFP